MNIQFDEQDVVDSTILYCAKKYDIKPEELDSELFFDKNNKVFFAKVRQKGFFNRMLNSHIDLNHAEMVDSIAFYLSGYYSFDKDALEIELQFDPEYGVIANINVLR